MKDKKYSSDKPKKKIANASTVNKYSGEMKNWKTKANKSK